jgi:Ni,Fe-hydrogenase III small subunit
MLALLRDLRRLRRDLSLSAPQRPASLAIRHVDAGSCNGCEHELTLTSGPYVDLQRFGLGIVASPRHADVLLVTGPITTRMREPVLAAYAAMPEPRRVAALGDCALGCNMLGTAEEIVGPVDALLPVDLRIPGCPPAPAAIAAALLGLIDATNNHHAKRSDMSHLEPPEQRWISVDGARFELVDGKWKYLSDRERKHVDASRNGSQPSVVPEGSVSVDGWVIPPAPNDP